jgi:hypothetical protein
VNDTQPLFTQSQLEAIAAALVVRELQSEGRFTKRGKPFDKGIVYKLINNRIYVGEAVHTPQPPVPCCS